jgi:hypothetical protein
MGFRTQAAFVVAVLAAVGVPLACSPQVVEVVDPGIDSGGAPSGGTSGTTGGGAGMSGAGDGGVTCPDGGSEADRDGDGVPDCLDVCPDDPDKTAGRGLCGCGLPDSAPDGGPMCTDLVAALAHRYAFNGTGIAVVDSAAVGNADGEIANTTLSGQGSLVLEGGMSDQYVALPNRILSSRPADAPETGSVTLEAWLRWAGGGNWQRIFDFGDNDGPQEGSQGAGVSYLFLTPKTPMATGNFPVQASKLRLAYKRPGEDEYEVTLDAPITMPSGVDTHVAVVIDGALQRMSLYVDGKLQDCIAHFRNVRDPDYTSMAGVYDWSAPVPSEDGGTVTPPAIDLTVVNDINNWLGRSQFSADVELQGTFYEFRIYSAALSPELVEISFKGGADAAFLQ